MRTKVILAVTEIMVVMGMAQTIQTLDLGAIQPNYIVSVDLNRDGFPDLAVSCHSSYNIVIFENTRSPCASFMDKVQWVLEDSPVALAAGYFMDPVCSPAAPTCFPYTTVFPNLVVVTQYQPGLVRFSPVEAEAPFLKLVPGGPLKVDVLPFTTLTHLALSDLNNDGAVDVIVLDGISMGVGVYLGNRPGLSPAVPAQKSASAPPAYLLTLDGREAYFLGVEDFDRDGLPDLVVSVDGHLHFFRNESSHDELKFALVAQVKLGTKLKGFALGDFNRDGYVDLAVVDPEFSALTILFNQGCWKFERGQRFKFDGGPVFVIAADLDRNGLLDLVVAEQEANRITIVINELTELGKINRPDPATYTVTPPEKTDVQSFRIVRVIEVGKNPVALVTDDFDKNGVLDLAVALFGDNKVQIIYNPCLARDCLGKVPCEAAKTSGPAEQTAGLSQPPAKEETPPVTPSGTSATVEEGFSFALPIADALAFTVGDLNGDSDFDLVLATPGTVHLYQRQGDGDFLARGDVYIGFKPDRLFVADLDGNGLADILAVNRQSKEAVVLLSSRPFLVGKAMFFTIPIRATDVLVLQVNDSKGQEIVWLTDADPIVWSLTPQAGLVEWTKAPSFLRGIRPPPGSVYTHLALSPTAIASAYYSANPAREIFITVAGRTVGEVVLGGETDVKAILGVDINGDGIGEILVLEGGRVRTFFVKGQ